MPEFEPALSLVTVTKMWPPKLQSAVSSNVQAVEQMSAVWVVIVWPSQDPQHLVERTTIQRAEQ